MSSDYRPLTRRNFLYLSASVPLVLSRAAAAAPPAGSVGPAAMPRTIDVLRRAFRIETVAHRHYVPFARQALAENLPNIAYLFQAFGVSESQHAENYRAVLARLGTKIVYAKVNVVVGDTGENLRVAAARELEKIRSVYPLLLTELERERHEDAIVNAMYSLKSHQQHEDQVTQIDRYAGMFFGTVADEIEGHVLDFHVCRVCGSTINMAPTGPCVICNRSSRNYVRVERPTAA